MKKMEVVVPAPPATEDFNFDRSSIPGFSFLSAPSSPRPFGNSFSCYYYDSAPTSPSRASAVSKDSLHLDWEEKPESSKLFVDDGDAAPFDFALGFSGQLEKGWSIPPLASADELFEDGRIRPLMTPPPRHSVRNGSSPAGEGSATIHSLIAKEEEEMRNRGRSISSPQIRRTSRSLSPIRGGGDSDFHEFQKTVPSSAVASFNNNSSLVKNGSGGSKRWRLRDLFLFRSASEGRATGRGSKDPLRRFSFLSPSSSTPSSSSSSSSSFPLQFFSKRTGREEGLNEIANGSSRRGRTFSAHAMHYAKNRAASEELKKRIPLPYHHNSMFSYLSFNPAASINRASSCRSSITRQR